MQVPSGKYTGEQFDELSNKQKHKEDLKRKQKNIRRKKNKMAKKARRINRKK